MTVPAALERKYCSYIHIPSGTIYIYYTTGIIANQAHIQQNRSHTSVSYRGMQAVCFICSVMRQYSAIFEGTVQDAIRIHHSIPQRWCELSYLRSAAHKLARKDGSILRYEDRLTRSASIAL